MEGGKSKGKLILFKAVILFCFSSILCGQPIKKDYSHQSVFLQEEEEREYFQTYKSWLQSENPIAFLEEVANASPYFHQTSYYLSPSILLSFFKKGQEQLKDSLVAEKNKLMTIGCYFANMLISQKDYVFAKEIFQLIENENNELPVFIKYNLEATKAFWCLFSGLEDSAATIAVAQIKSLDKEIVLSDIEKSILFCDLLSIFAIKNDFKTAEVLFTYFDKHHKQSIRNKKTTLERKRLEWIFLSSSLQLYSQKDRLQKSQTVFNAIETNFRKKYHFEIGMGNLENFFNTVINYAIILRLEERPEEAERVNLIGLEMAKDLFFSDAIAGFYGNLAYLSIDKKNYAQTYEYAKKAVRFGEIGNIAQLTNYYNILGTSCTYLNKKNETKNIITKVIKILLKTDVSWDNIGSLELHEIDNQDYSTLTFALEGIGRNMINLSRIENNKEYLELAQHFYNLAAMSYGRIVNSARYGPNLSFLNENIHKRLLEICLLLDDCNKEKILMTVEKNKSKTLLHELLFSNLNFGKAASNSELLEIKELEKKLARQLSDNILFDSKSKDFRNKQRIAINEIQNEIIEWQNNFNKNHPQFKALFNQLLQFEDVTSELGDGDIIMRYFFFDNQAYLFEISNTSSQLYFLGDGKAISDEIKKYLAAIKDPSSDYFTPAIRVFEKLLPNWSHVTEKSNIFIVPDGSLHQLPFEALISSDKRLFLVEQKNISYFRNLSHFFYSKKFTSSKNSNFFIYNPIYTAGLGQVKNTTKNLPGAQKEAEAISEYLEPVLRQGKAATTENFFQDCEVANLMHIAAHAVANTIEEPHFLFTDKKLYFHELYARRIPAELVVLSACNTGISSLAVDDNFESLGQAFSFAGVASLIYTLWEIPDAQTALLMKNFYKRLNEGETKINALTNAKLDFLENATTTERHPFFWSAFVLQGNENKLNENQPVIGIWPLSLIIGISILASVLFYRKYFFKNTTT